MSGRGWLQIPDLQGLQAFVDDLQTIVNYRNLVQNLIKKVHKKVHRFKKKVHGEREIYMH